MKTRKNIRKHYLRRQKKVGGFFGKSKTVDSKSVQSSQPSESIYGIKIMALDEKTPLDLNQFKGKKIKQILCPMNTNNNKTNELWYHPTTPS